ncbi:hypothetical protein DY000_02043059 [Brassica cretica]|uniref:Uncharacterized protein n=1 Tax=Brassica cretica TaxID=69181 RepID=A0ABQ7BG38_BRACR|nr:hypothetical protein DY000_02043059 [Brassica cretica]
MGEDGPRRGHLSHGRGWPAPRSPRPWARTARAKDMIGRRRQDMISLTFSRTLLGRATHFISSFLSLVAISTLIDDMPGANCASFKNHVGDLSSKDKHTPGANDGTCELADAVKTT